MSFNVCGVKVNFNFSFLLVVALAILINSGNLLNVLLFSALHECGHILSLFILGGNAEKITVSYYGIGLKRGESLPFFRELIFLLSGVSVNLFFTQLKINILINLALVLINILPVYPLDGGRVAALILFRLLPFKAAEAIIKAISVICILFLLIIAVLFKNVSLILIIIYIVFYSINFRGNYD